MPPEEGIIKNIVLACKQTLKRLDSLSGARGGWSDEQHDILWNTAEYIHGIADGKGISILDMPPDTSDRDKNCSHLCDYLEAIVQHFENNTDLGNVGDHPQIDMLIGNDSRINEVLLLNQAFSQSIGNLKSAIQHAKDVTQKNNRLSSEEEQLQIKMLSYFEDLDVSLTKISRQIDLSTNPIAAYQNTSIKNWFRDEWPEAIEKLNEYTSKKALADMLIPTGIVAAFGILGAVVGPIFGASIAVGFSAGGFVGMFATRQVSTKDASKRLNDSLSENNTDQEN